MPPKGGINRLSYACDCLNVAYLFEVLADGFYILNIVHVNPEGALKDSVVALDVHLLDVGMELLRDYGCYLVQDAHVVNTGYLIYKIVYFLEDEICLL